MMKQIEERNTKIQKGLPARKIEKFKYSKVNKGEE